MRKQFKMRLLATSVAIALLSGCGSDDAGNGTDADSTQAGALRYFAEWPEINSAIAKDEAIEAFVADILGQMTLEEKVGQMIQPDLRGVSPQEAAEYKLGSLLNGGGGWPNEDKHASAADWANEADKYWAALEQAYADRGFRIPFMWATDAVHGHNNVYKATVFPHNIGLGAANDPDLIYRIGKATAKEVAATGLDWTFAPTVATPRDYRWGRVYEGYSEDPEIVHRYAGKMVEGIQGTADDLKGEHHVISNVKHWVGDGGTFNGVDRGDNRYSEDYLRNIHATGYFSGLEAGAQVVMSSFNSWSDDANYAIADESTGVPSEDYNNKIHGSKYLLTDVLKDKMGFDGVIVSDWNGHKEVSGCTDKSCPAAVNAGIDIFMVTANSDWKAFYQDILDNVDAGVIPMARIDDAVTRILRVKARAGLWDKPMPSARALAGNSDILGSAEHRALAREAVRKSLVLLKNNNNVLPLSRDSKVLVTGSAANDIQKQTGGWSLTWQGSENTLEDFPGATTVKMAVEQLLDEEHVSYAEDVSTVDPGAVDVALVVIGEDPYAEMVGDIRSSQTLAFSELKSTYNADLETIRTLKAAGVKVVTVFYSGRPLYVNEEINLSDAFVAGWLPGSEGVGVTDVLFRDQNGDIAHDFQGRLSFSWPNKKCSTTINRVPVNLADYVTPEFEQDISGEHAPLFPYGYGLTYADSGSEQDLNNLVLDDRDFGCSQTDPGAAGVATSALEVWGLHGSGEHVARVGDPSDWSEDVSGNSTTELENIRVTPIDYQHQQDARSVTFKGGIAQFYTQTEDEQGVDRYDYVNANSTLQFDVRMVAQPEGDVVLATHCEYPCAASLNATSLFHSLPVDEWTTVKVPLACFAEEGMEFATTNSPFLVYSESPMQLDLANVRWVPESVDAAGDAVSCDLFAEDVLIPLDEAESAIFVGGTFGSTWDATIGSWTAKTGSDWSAAEGLLSYEVVGEELRVTYSDAPEDHKGLIWLQGGPQNLSNYLDSGTLQFELYVDRYGANTQGLTVKMEGKDGTGPDYSLGAGLALGQWQSVSVNLSDLGLEEVITSINKPFAILPAWGESQANVAFRVKNVKLVK